MKRSIGFLTGMAVLALGVWLLLRGGDGGAVAPVDRSVEQPIEATAVELARAEVTDALREPAPTAEASGADAAVLLTGLVRDADDARPLGGARVFALRANRTQHLARTDADGRYELPRDEPVFDTLFVLAEGYVTRWVEREAIARHAAESPRVPLVTELVPGDRLLVRVLGADSSPIESCGVAALYKTRGREDRLPDGWPLAEDLDDEGQPRYVTYVTDATGRCALGGLPCGVPLVVTVSTGAVRQSSEVTLDAATRSGELEIVLAATARVHGVLAYDDGAPLDEDAPRRVLLESTRGQARADVGVDGSFAFDDAPLGSASLRLSGGRRESVSVRVVAPETDLGTLLLEHRGPLRGRVLPEGTYHVTAVRDGRFVGSFLTDEEGRFDARIRVGRVELRAGTPAAEVRLPEGGVVVDVPADGVLLDLSGMLGSLELSFLGGVTGKDVSRVMLARARGPAEATNRPDPALLRYATTPTPTGVLVEPISPGTYDLLVDAGAQGTAWVAGIVIGPEQRPTKVDCAFGFAELRAVAASDEGEIPDVEVLLASSVFGRITARLGEIVRVTAGPWRACPVIVGAGRESSRRVTLLPGESREVALDLDRVGDVECRLVGELRGVTGASLVLLEGPDAYDYGDGFPTRTPDDDGIARFERLAPGRYVVQMRDEAGVALASQRVQVAAGEVTRCEFARATTTLELRLAGLDAGDSIHNAWVADDAGGVARALVVAEDRVRAGAGSERFALVARVRPSGSMDSREQRTVVAIGTSPAGREGVLELSPGTESLVVELAEGLDEGDAPAVCWQSVAGIDLAYFAGPAPELRGAWEAPRRLRFDGLHADAVLELTSEDAAGSVTRRVVRLAELAGGPVAWP